MGLFRCCVVIFLLGGLQNVHGSNRTSVSAGLRYLAKIFPVNRVGVSITNVGPCQIYISESLSSQKIQLHLQDLHKTVILGGVQDKESIVVDGKIYTSFAQVDSLAPKRDGFKMSIQQVIKRSEILNGTQDMILIFVFELEKRSIAEPLAITSITGELWSHRNFIFDGDELQKDESGSIRCAGR